MKTFLCVSPGYLFLPNRAKSFDRLFPYSMKKALTPAMKAAKRQQIAEVMRASFRIEGIQISAEQAQAALREVKVSLGKTNASF